MRSDLRASFNELFQSLTGNPPFPWQRRLFESFVESPGELPESCSLPTGLGKTAVIAIWLLALAHHRGQGFPRRLAYVVNRRTVVDQATDEAENILGKLMADEAPPALVELRERLQSFAAIASEPPLAISTMRGQRAESNDWCRDPARAAIVVGTVDMIGSRLLFSGYRLGFRRWPLHAGLLGQDTLLVHDEAHLEPAFQALLLGIEREQQSEADCFAETWKGDLSRRLRVMELSATTRSESAGERKVRMFGLEKEDFADETIRRRVTARKGLALHTIEDEKKLPDKLAELALVKRDSGQAILVFAHSVEVVEKVVARIQSPQSGTAKNSCIALTGTLRGFERDRLTGSGLSDVDLAAAEKDKPWEVFARFLPAKSIREGVKPREGTVYLVCTSAGEVGINISAQHLACDLTCYESMAQRLGRVNRFGEGDAGVDVVLPPAFDDAKPIDEHRRRTLALLKMLPVRDDGRWDASPGALRRLAADHETQVAAAFSPKPEILPLTDILLDAWSLTTITEPIPGRPPVADWLHGVEEDQPVTYFAWRKEVAETAFALGETVDDQREFGKELAEYLDAYRLRTHEQLQIPSYRALKHLKGFAQRQPKLPAWLVDGRGQVQVVAIEKLGELDVAALNERTIILPPAAGGLTAQGMLDGSAGVAEEIRYDVADIVAGDAAARARFVWNGSPESSSYQGLDRYPHLRLNEVTGLIEGFKRLPDVALAEDDEGNARRLCPFIERSSIEDDETRSRFSMKEQALQVHLDLALQFAQRIASQLGLPVELARTAEAAAAMHDLGKDRTIWQRGIGNVRKDHPLAKSGRSKRIKELEGYRHEFGSLLDGKAHPYLAKVDAELHELLFQSIGAHHGRARPHFPTRRGMSEAFDPERDESLSTEEARKTARRFAHLQRQYGRWGLAWLESILRAADYLASE